MTKDRPASYDTTEALEILAAFAEKTKPDKIGAEEAAEALLEELFGLRLSVKNADIEKAKCMGRAAVAVITEKASAWVQYVEGSFEIFKGVVRDDPDPATKITLAGLSYNPAKKILEGVAQETFRTPLPGAPVEARRSALAVVLKEMLKLIEADSEPATTEPFQSPKRRI